MKKILGIELGSTRIKGVLINEKGELLAGGNYEWENILTDGLWSYPLERAIEGLQSSYSALAKDYEKKYGEALTEIDAIGISAMMHGYIALDEENKLLAPFRTWRNTNTPAAAAELSGLFSFNIPMRWSVSQYYQSVLDGLDHVKKIKHLTTLSGYIHCLLTGKRVIGADDASGMFPIKDGNYDGEMLKKFNSLLKTKGIDTDFSSLLPAVLMAGENGGYLTESGAKLLDVSGRLRAGIPFCPPEGDMGTGMVATNSVRKNTANISSGTSANISVIAEKPLSRPYRDADVISTPDGLPAFLLHTNNCTGEADRWVSLLGEAIALSGAKVSKDGLYGMLYKKALEADEGLGGVVSYNFRANEPIVTPKNGFPAVICKNDGSLTLANLMRAQIYGAISAIYFGLDILKEENIKIESVIAHGGYYKTEYVGQLFTSAMLKAPVTVMKNAGEGGAWGIALLALYMFNTDKSLPDFLDGIFAGAEKTTVCADEREIKMFEDYIENYKKGLEIFG